MKTTFKTAFKTAAVIAALAYAGASHAAYTATSHFGGSFSNPVTSASFNAGHPTGGVDVYDVTDGVHKYFAFCIDAATPIVTNASYSASDVTGSVSDAVKRLYEYSYSSVSLGQNNTVAFQLALWELTSDDSSFSTGAQYFAGVTSSSGILKLNLAKDMLAAALDTSIAIKGAYNYVQFATTGVTKSQTLMAVSPVPEADTWAMMGVGLGLIGLVGRRRKSAQTEKFA